MKFEIEPLVAEMLDRLPNGVWTSNSTTFFDPAIGGGQFVCAIEQRLRTHGHSNANIRKRVFGLENSELYVRYAVNKHKLVGQYAKKTYKKFFELDNTMKFDVVVGNPPYQDTVAPTKKLWPTFLEKAFELTKANGYVAFITPRSWLERPQSQLSGKIVNNILSKNALVYVDITAKDHFDVGEKPCAYMLQKTSKNGLTKFIFGDHNKDIDYSGQKIAIEGNDEFKISIFDKFNAYKGNRFLKYVYNDVSTQDSIDTAILKGHMSKGPKNSTDVNVFWTASNFEYYTPASRVKAGIKVIINRSGYYYQDKNPTKYILTDATMQYAIGAGAFGITCATATEAANLTSLLTTKLYRWYIDNEKTSGFNTGIAKLPWLGVHKAWTDIEVYKLFNLTQEEIDHVNSCYA
jgi:hypothetical protein